MFYIKLKKTDNSLKTYKETLIIFLVAKSKIARQEKCKNAYLMQAEKSFINKRKKILKTTIALLVWQHCVKIPIRLWSI